MAKTMPNTGIIRPWDHSKNRYVHRRIDLTMNGSGAASGSVSIPCPGRLVAMQYGVPNATDSLGVVGSGLTNGQLVLKAETTAGVAIFTASDVSTEVILPTPVGTTAIDDGAHASAATDGYSGGFPVRQGVFAAVTGGTEAEVLQVDMWFRLCTWVKLQLSSQTGADGSGAVTRTVRVGNAGVLSAVAIDYANEPSTTDIAVYADTENGPLLFINHATGSNTAQAPTLLAIAGMDETAAATAVTDGTEGGSAFKQALYIAVAQADAYTTGNEVITMELWIDD